MRIGQLITSFLQGKGNPTMTSTIFSPYVDRVMEESRTAYFNGSHGATPGTNRGRGIGKGRGATKHKGVPQSKTVGGRVLRAINDLLPYSARPIKPKRRRRWGGYTLGVELYTFRLVWRSHHWPKLKQRMRKLVESGKVWWK
jgi:hypothetical protein